MTDSSDTPEPPGNSPDASAAASAAAEATPPAGTGRGRRLKLLAIVAGGLVVLLLVQLVLVGRALDWWASEPAAPTAAPSPEPTASPAPSPFAGTPAEHFAEGADGIVLPPAEAVGDFTAEEVADALEQVKQALIAARLDPAVLVDHDLEPFLSVMATDQQQALATAIDANGYGAFPTQIAPDAELVPLLPRVAGNLSYEFVIVGPPDAPILEIATSFVWVYPFEAAVVVIRDDLAWEARVGRPWLESSQGVWLTDGVSAAWGADCEAYQDGLLRPATGSVPDLAAEDIVIFDPDRPLDAGDGC